MALHIPAIQTRYHGYHFRSRLEARWAVFFETMAVQWTYEPEGFELPSGRRYLPDFHIAGVGWIEIKPKLDNWDGMPWLREGSLEEEFFTPTMLTATSHGPFPPGGCIVGEPGHVIDGDQRSSYAGAVWGDTCYYFCECPACGALGFQFSGNSARNSHRPACGAFEPGGGNPNPNSPRLQGAYDAARSARFIR